MGGLTSGCSRRDGGRTNIFLIPISVPGRFSITLRPRGGDWLTDDLRALRMRGVDVLVSLLEPPEQMDLGLALEALLCAEHHIRFVHVPVPDLGVPTKSGEFLGAAEGVLTDLRAGRSVAVHCRQSVGRSGLFAVTIAMATGMRLPEALQAVSTSRGVEVPETLSQLNWLRQHEHRVASLAG